MRESERWVGGEWVEVCGGGGGGGVRERWEDGWWMVDGMHKQRDTVYVYCVFTG